MRFADLSPLSLVALLALVGCNEEAALPDEDVEECEIDGPTLVLAQQDDWNLEDPVSGFSLSLVGERLLYAIGDRPPASADHYLRDLCGGEPELVLAAASGLHWSFTSQSSVGPVLFGTDGEGRLYAADRLDEPGADTPRMIANYPGAYGQAGSVAVERHDGGRMLFVERHGEIGEPSLPVAAIGTVTRTLWAYSGEPDEDAALLADDVVHYSPMYTYRPDSMLVHFDDGRIAWVDQETLAEQPIRDGVRWFGLHWYGERPHLLYQAIGDGESEAVRLRDLETGEERPLTVNPFADVSFGQDPDDRGTGGWLTGAVLGLIGPEHTIVEAYHPETLAPIEVPAHVGLAGVWGAEGLVGLVLPDPDEHVRALWDPATGTVTEWYRGPVPDASTLKQLEWKDGKIVFREDNADGTERIVELDVASGERRVVLSQVGHGIATLEDGRLLHTIDVDDELNRQVILSDPATGVSKVLVDRTQRTSFSLARGGLLLYTDMEAETPGVYVTSMPPR